MDILILRHRWNVLAAAAILILGLALGPVHAALVMESARDIPIAASADVVVDGSSTAVAAAEGGAKVYLIANGIEKEHYSRVYCLNDADGSIVWQQDIEATVQQIKVLEPGKSAPRSGSSGTGGTRRSCRR